ncbi:MAG: hypothetical protein ACLUO4_07730 [Christensenellales bacterium]
MKQISSLIRRNIKLYFKDKGLFFVSLITPVILLVLFATFLANVYKVSFVSALPVGMALKDALINAMVGGQLVSSLLAVSCVTVAFCSNSLMVQDKLSGARRDLLVTPVRRSVLSVSYFAACTLSTLIVNFVAMGLCLAYLAITGWYLAVADVCLLALDVLLRCLAGALLYPFLFEYPGPGVRRGHDGQRRIRLFVRGVYADFQLFRRFAAGDVLFARHVRHRFIAQPRAGGGVSRNAGRGLSG